MPSRFTPLINNEYYHIFNRGNAKTPIFKTKYDYRKFINIFLYYLYANLPCKYSKFTIMSTHERNSLLNILKKKNEVLIEIIAYCLMPNHFHFLLRQVKDKGVMNFLRLSCNSYSHYFNTRYKRKGGLFEGRFKAVRVESDEQLLHLTRYIHLNPYSSYVVKDTQQLLTYPFSSLKEYVGRAEVNICHTDQVLGQFSSKKSYKNFVLKQKDYQRSLEEIKHLILEN